ncbi:DUF6406 domain-containing protein [Streptomyces sp. NPDC004647]|uniref:DUF6406 domain-containing protein n=1 Tax=Streptomyces sp. NPDC004647 TaxID=3154671 RepID=UPI0033A2398D
MNTVHLWHGIQASSDSGRFSVIYVSARPGQEVKVRLCVVSDEEHRYTLNIGDTFPVRDEIWQLSRVEDLPSDDWTVVLDKVSPSPESAPSPASS